ncbi:MAG: DUF1810 domain-containing protein [Thomasclavelia sp.]
MSDLNRFLKAQETSYLQALTEIKNGRKTSHWIWYIFPQLKGLGMSSTADYYGIESLDEAIEYLQEPTLKARLYEITEALLKLEETNPVAVLGYPDNLKVCSSMTLFYQASKDELFKKVIDKYYHGYFDHKTITLLMKK